MRIKSQLRAVSVFAIIVLIIFISFYIVAASKYKNAKTVNAIVDDLQIKFFESTTLRDQYFLYREDRPREQWYLLNEEIDRLLQKLDSLKVHDEIIKELLLAKKKASALVFRIFENTSLLKSSISSKQVYYEFDNRLISQVHIRYNEFRNGLQDIHNETEEQLEKTYRDLIFAITILAVILSLIVIFISFHLIRLISKRIEDIHDGAEVISQGKLDYRIKVVGDDEFSELASSINFMTSKLQANNEQLEIEREKTVQNAKMASLGEMSASIAHEINNPLSVIQLNNSRLMEKLKIESLSPDSIILALEKNKSAVERINKIIKSLLRISRNAAHEDIQEFSAKSMMDQVLSLCSQKLKYSNIDLTVSIPPDDIYLESSITQISQVLINLINNAHDAIANKSEKWIKVEFLGNDEFSFVQCSVTDSGHGIPKDIAGKIMRPFFTTKDVGKGTGLGLSISKEIIENLGGKFYIDTNCPNTRFVFELPKVFKR